MWQLATQTTKDEEGKMFSRVEGKEKNWQHLSTVIFLDFLCNQAKNVLFY